MNREIIYRRWILTTIEQYGITKTAKMIDEMVTDEVQWTLETLIRNMFNL